MTRARNNLEFRQLTKLENLYDLGETLNNVQQFYGAVSQLMADDRRRPGFGRARSGEVNSVRDRHHAPLCDPTRLPSDGEQARTDPLAALRCL